MSDFQGIRNVNIEENVLNSDLGDGNKNKTNHFIIVERILYNNWNLLLFNLRNNQYSP